MKAPKIITRRLLLDALTEKDLPYFTRWFRDKEVVQFLNIRNMGRMTTAKERVWLRKNRKSKEDFVCAIREKKTQQLIGNAGIMHIDHLNHTAELGIVIGDKAAWGKGYGPETITALLRYVFRKLKLQNVMLTCDCENSRGMRAYEKIGFQRMGVRRKGAFSATHCGRRDVIFYDITPGDLRR